MTDLFWGIIVALALAVPVLAYRVAYRLGSGAVAVISPLLGFSIFWWLGYPLKAALLGWGLVTTQTGWAPQQGLLLKSVGLSAIFALIILYGAARAYRSFPAGWDDGAGRLDSASWRRAILFLAFCLLLSLYTLTQTVWIDFQFDPWKPYEQNWARYGKGWLFFWADGWIHAGIAVLSGFLMYRNGLPRKAAGAMAALVAILVAWSLVVGLAFASRRMMFAILLATMVVVTIIYHRKNTLRLSLAAAWIVCLAPLTAAGPFDAVRYLWMDAQIVSGPAASGPQNSERRILLMQEYYRLSLTLQSLASSFEGAEHLARYIERGGEKSILWGEDMGQSWLFNAGLALVPRQLWKAKPVEAGSVAQQCWLWPKACPATRRDAAYIPPGFAVDFLFGFGVLGAALLALATGRFLGLVHRNMWYGTNPWKISVSVLVYVYLFNLARGGTAFLQMLIPMVALAMMTWGIPRRSSAGESLERG